MADWQLERGIGEDRAVHMAEGEIFAARLDWLDGLAAGQVENAVLIARTTGSSRGTARFASGEEALVDRLPKDAREGASLRLGITRSAIAERGRFKLAQARPTADVLCPRPTLEQTLQREGHNVSVVHRFPADADWEELFVQCWSGTIAYSGGELLFANTPAMTLIDIDGSNPLAAAQAAVPAIASALPRCDLGGSIGIDFPTLPDKAQRKAIDDGLAQGLAHWPHERTAMNGFGFVHIVARLQHVSVLHRIAGGRVGAAARILLRRAENIIEPGALLLTAHPGVKARLKDGWLAELARRTGREIRLASDPGLALDGGFAQAVPL